MKSVVSVVSIRYNLYYGVSALFFLFSIVFPLTTPFISMLVFGSIAWRLATRGRNWDDDDKTPAWIVFFISLVMIATVIINSYFYIAFFPKAKIFWDLYVESFVPFLRIIAKASGTAVTLGALVYLFLYGTSEYELLFKKSERPKEIAYVRILQVFLFILCLLLIWIEKPDKNGQPTQPGIFTIIQYSAIGLNVIIILGNSLKSKKISGANRSVISYVLMIAFFVFSALKERAWDVFILMISSLLYLITFLVMFYKADDD
ncbi:MAG: hypothetical protein ACTSVI_02300 [Promethearchaeota archaeon]